MCLTHMSSLSKLNTNNLIALDTTNHSYTRQMDFNLKINSENVSSSSKLESHSNKKNSPATTSSTTISRHSSSEYTMSNSGQNENLANSFSKYDGDSRSERHVVSEKHTQSNKAFCKFCITELTIFQIGFEEAIQLCTNINCFQYKDNFREFNIESCLIRRDYKADINNSSTQNEHENKLKESNINKLVSHIVETEISLAQVIADASSVPFLNLDQGTLGESNQKKESAHLFDDFSIDQSIQEYDTNNTCVNLNNNTINNDLDDFFQVTNENPHDTVTMPPSNSTSLFNPLDNHIQMFNTSNEDLTHSAQFQSVMNSINSNELDLDVDLSDLLYSDSSDFQYLDNTQTFSNSNNNNVNNNHNNDNDNETLTYTDLDNYNSLFDLSQNETLFKNNETIVLDESLIENKTIVDKKPTSKSENLPEEMPNFDANGNPIIGYARAKSGKSSILITKIKTKTTKAQGDASQTKLKIIEDKEQILELVNTIKSESETKKRKYDDIMQIENKTLLPWEKKKRESTKPKKSTNYNVESVDPLELKQKYSSTASSPSYSNFASSNESKSVSRFSQESVITKADLSKKASGQKINFQERGSDLKRALMGDSSFLSTIKNSPASSNATDKPTNSYKDLLLNVLKKSNAT